MPNRKQACWAGSEQRICSRDGGCPLSKSAFLMGSRTFQDTSPLMLSRESGYSTRQYDRMMRLGAIAD